MIRMEKAFADDQSVRPDFLKEETKEIVPAFIAEKKTQEVSRGALRELPCTGLWSALIFAIIQAEPVWRSRQSGCFMRDAWTGAKGTFADGPPLYLYGDRVAKRMMQAAGSMNYTWKSLLS